MKIRTLMKKINPMMPQDRLKYSKGLNQFASKYEGRNTENIEWLELCADVRKYGCYRYGLLLLVAILETHLYHGEYAEYLYPLLPALKELAEQHSTSYSKIFCEDNIRYLIIGNRQSDGDYNHAYVTVKTENRYIIRALKKERFLLQEKHFFFYYAEKSGISLFRNRRSTHKERKILAIRRVWKLQSFSYSQQPPSNRLVIA